MSRKLISLSAATFFIGSTAIADVPSVATDIAPVHSLVSRVMRNVGEPNLIIPTIASPHMYNLRPSEAKALQDANLVFWMGDGLSPWMKNALGSLASDAKIIELLDQKETELLEFREGALFEEHDHDDHDDHDDHAHGKYDPHAWLSLSNAKNWLNLIAAQLSASDPKNAGIYFANAAEAREELESLIAEVNTLLDPVRGIKFVVFHDAYQYFEHTFDIQASGAIALGDASAPSPARISEVQGRIKEEGIDLSLIHI